MTRKLHYAIILTLGYAIGASAQGVRYDGSPVQALVSNGTAAYPSVVAVNNAQINWCQHPANSTGVSGSTLTACTNYATTYTSLSLAIACTNGTQVVLQSTSTCVALADGGGNWGVNVSAGTYDYTISIGSLSYGPFVATPGLSSSGTGVPVVTNPTGAALQTIAGPLNVQQGTGNVVITNPSASQTIGNQPLIVQGNVIATAGQNAINAFNINGIIFIDNVKYACSEAGIASALTAAGVGGTVHAEGCLASFTWSSTLAMSTASQTLYLPCTIMTFTVQIMTISADDIRVLGCGSGSSGQMDQRATFASATQFTASGIANTVDGIIVTKGVQTTQALQRISGITLSNFIINMNSLGRRAIETEACWDCSILDTNIYNDNCTVGNGAVTVAGGPVGGTTFAASYFWQMKRVKVFHATGNTTCNGFFFDATLGEIAYSNFDSLWVTGVQTTTGSGADAVLVDTSASNTNGSFDQNVFTNLKVQDPVAGATACPSSSPCYGLKFKARGNMANTTNGRVFNIQLNIPQLERIFSTAGSGIGMGCVNGSNTADGTGCGFISAVSISNGGWLTNEDALNMGLGFNSLADQAGGASGPLRRMSGAVTGNNAQGERVDVNLTPTGNSQQVFAFGYIPNTTNGSNTGTTFYMGPYVDMSNSGTHTGVNTNVTAIAHYCNAFNTNGGWSATGWCFYGAGPANEHLEGVLQMGGSSQSSTGNANNVGTFWYDQTNQKMTLSNNNGGFGTVITPTCTTSQKTESAADANVLTCGIQGSAGTYRIRFVMSVSAANAATLGWTATWTDSNGNAQTPANLALFQSGTALPALTFTTSAAGNYYGYADIDVNNASVSPVVKLTFSGTSFTAKVTATIERII